MDVLAPVVHLQHAALVALALALLAHQLDVGQELHLDRDGAVALAGLAAAAGDVEAEVPDGVAALPGFRSGSEDRPDGVKRLQVGDWVGARGASDG